MHSNMPVLMEFFTDHIPSARHLLVVRYGVAEEWMRRGAHVKITAIDNTLIHQAAQVAITKVWQ
jgi:hypothetical protein